MAQFNQAYSAQGASDLDRNDWIYGNFVCPAATVYVQDAIACLGQAVPIGTVPETTVLRSLGYDSSHPQTITFNALPGVTFGIAPLTLVASATSGLTVTFTSTTLTVCLLKRNFTLTVIAAGGCSITASQPGNANYSAAPNVIQGFTVSKASQTITFGSLANVNIGVAPFNITATDNSGLTITFTSTTTGVCTISGTVTIVATGSCSITASQGGNTNYNAATPVPQSFTVFPPCTLSLTSSSYAAIAPGGSSSVGVTASAGACSWTASSNASWLTITAGASGTGSGTVNYSIATNPAAARSGTMTIAGHTFTVDQIAANPVLDINALEQQSGQSSYYDPVGATGYAGLSKGWGGFRFVYKGFTPGFDAIRYGDLIGDGKSDLIAYNSATALGYALLGSGEKWHLQFRQCRCSGGRASPRWPQGI